MGTKESNPKQITIYGRLSFPNFIYAEAVKRNATSQFPKADPAEVTPDFNLLLEQAQLDKFKAHVTNVFLPYALKRASDGETKDMLSQKTADKIIKMLESDDYEDQPPYIPLKPVPAKTKDLAPEALVSMKINGNRGQDIELKAIVNEEAELAVPEPDLMSFPVVRPINRTVHSMYGGCYVAATLNLYAYETSGASKGFSASAGVAVFKGEGERFGGGASVDESEIFLD